MCKPNRPRVLSYLDTWCTANPSVIILLQVDG